MKLLTIVETLSTRSRRVFIACMLTIVVVAIGLGAVARARRADAPSTAASASEIRGADAGFAKSPVPIQNARTPITIDGIRVTLRRTGFEPEEITRPQGKFLLLVDNVTGLGEMTFRLLRQNGSRERDLTPRRDRFRLRQVVDLPAGRYALVEADHPDWICHITIAAR